MSDISWIKLKTDMFDDEKIRLIESMPDADTILVIWIKLLTLTGKTNQGGFLMLNDRLPYTDEMLATLLNRPLNTVRLALETFHRFGMVTLHVMNGEKILQITNWNRHQNVEGMDKIRADNRERVARYRAKQKAQALENTGFQPSELKSGRNVTVTLPVTRSNALEEDKELDKEKEKDIPRKRGPRKTLLSEDFAITPAMREWAQAKKLQVDIDREHERFINHHIAKANKYADWERAWKNWMSGAFVSKQPASAPRHRGLVL